MKVTIENTSPTKPKNPTFNMGSYYKLMKLGGADHSNKPGNIYLAVILNHPFVNSKIRLINIETGSPWRSDETIDPNQDEFEELKISEMVLKIN